MDLTGTLFAIIPPLVAIILGLITKKVNISLIVGIVLGILFYTGFNPIEGLKELFSLIIKVVGGNMGVVVFLVLLGWLVYVMNKSGASAEYASWASKRLKTKKASLLATFLLGVVIFIDDYFNCLTVGTVMKPITDSKGVSREKLAYIIDTTAAPVCMIAPVSSWAAAVSSSLPADSTINGFNLFIDSITANYYSLFSIMMVLLIIILNVDFGKMKKFEKMAPMNLNIKGSQDSSNEEAPHNPKARVIDLILPVVFLIVACILSMLYTGGAFSGKNIIDAFMECDAILSLCMGSGVTILFTMLLYIPRKVIKFSEFMDGIVEGFHHMVPAIIILSLAWSLGSVCGANYLNAGAFLEEIVQKYNIAFGIMPLIFFILSAFFAFSTGTSWGTFVILIPMCVNLFGGVESELLAITIAAILGGSVCGDHLSPISDTTILSSTGAGCNHIYHVQSQFFYGLFAAGFASLSYIIAGFTESKYMGLGIGMGLLIISLVGIKLYYHYKNKANLAQ